eukprot:GGOE01020913.1.p1 GENE.GGOE01020913.1~~GGOE01020913.1.p1  ORF type:complete len:353 (+),score=94.76 GGOE01020913.1:34-1059(+)
MSELAPMRRVGPPLSFPRHPAPTFPRRRIFEGIFAPCPTPYNSDGSPNLAAIPIMAKKMVDDGLHGIFVNGTLAEGVLNTAEARKATAEAWLAFAGPKETRGLKIIVHVGCEDAQAARELAAHAEANGADGVACTPPLIFKPKVVAGLVDYLAHVAAGCPRTPFLYYHCTFLTGPTFRGLDILKEMDLAIPNARGCKFTDRDIGDLAMCFKYFPDMDILPAWDNQFLSYIGLGASAFVVGGSNLIAPLYLKCWLLAKEGDFEGAQAAMSRMLDFFERLDCHNAGIYGKLCHTTKIILGLKCGMDLGPPKRPIALLAPEEVEGLTTTLKEWGWVDWAVTPAE